MTNADIKAEIVRAGIKHYEIADKLGIHEGTFSRLFRSEMPEEKKTEILAAIKELQKERD